MTLVFFSHHIFSISWHVKWNILELKNNFTDSFFNSRALWPSNANFQATYFIFGRTVVYNVGTKSTKGYLNTPAIFQNIDWNLEKFIVIFQGVIRRGAMGWFGACQISQRLFCSAQWGDSACAKFPRGDSARCNGVIRRSAVVWFGVRQIFPLRRAESPPIYHAESPHFLRRITPNLLVSVAHDFLLITFLVIEIEGWNFQGFIFALVSTIVPKDTFLPFPVRPEYRSSRESAPNRYLGNFI